MFKIYTHFKALENPENIADGIIIEGIVSTPSVDRQSDIVLTSAWKSLKNFKANPIVLFQHDHTQPIGKVTDIENTPNGLFVRALISPSAGKTYNLIKEGILKTFSASFISKDYDFDKTKDAFVIKDAELLEVSVVSVPANADTLFSVRKSFDGDEASFKNFRQHARNLQEEKLMNEEMQKQLDALRTEFSKSIEDVKAKALEEAKIAAETARIAKEEAAAAKEASILVGKSGGERLLDEVQKRLDSQQTDLGSLRDEIKSRKEELEALQKSKMVFTDKGSEQAYDKDALSAAMFVSKSLSRRLNETKIGKRFLEKAGTYLPDTNTDIDTIEGWESTWSTNVHNNVRQQLVVEPIFNGSRIQMPTETLYLGTVSDVATAATWVDPAITVSNHASNTTGSTGTASYETIGSSTLIAKKLAAKTFLSMDDEEDSLIALAPIIMSNLERAMARALDKAILRGAGSGASDPLVGVAKVANTANLIATALDISDGDKLTVAAVREMRQLLGIYGLVPRDLVLIVNPTEYYNLLDDADLKSLTDRTTTGYPSTIVTGAVNFVDDIPVVVSGEFEAKADTKYAAVLVRPANFILGNYRNMRLESEYQLEYQRKLMVATQRIGFTNVESYGAAVIKYTA